MYKKLLLTFLLLLVPVCLQAQSQFSGGGNKIKTAADVVGLFTTCSGTQYLGADGACHTITATAPGGAANTIQYNNAGAFGGFGSWNGSTLSIPNGSGAGLSFLNTNSQVTSSSGAYLNFNAGAISLTAAGTNQNITLTPSGTGKTVLASGPLQFLGNSAGNIFAGANNAALSGTATRNGTAALFLDPISSGVDSVCSNSSNAPIMALCLSSSTTNVGKFFVLQTGVLGTRDMFFQVIPDSGAGYAYLEGYSSAGMAVGTGGNSAPVLIRPNRTTTATFATTGTTLTGITKSDSYATGTNCSSSASPAVCGSAAAGMFVIAASATSVVVNTTAVTANSEIMVTEDQSLGTALSVTCNAGITQPVVTARTAGTSFTVSISAGLATNPVCFSYEIVN